MRFVDGLTQSEIAAAVGVSQMHVSRLLRQALEQLGEEIETAMRGEGRIHAGDPNTVELRLPPHPENLALARLALTGVAGVAGLSEPGSPI